MHVAELHPWGSSRNCAEWQGFTGQALVRHASEFLFPELNTMRHTGVTGSYTYITVDVQMGAILSKVRVTRTSIRIIKSLRKTTTLPPCRFDHPTKS